MAKQQHGVNAIAQSPPSSPSPPNTVQSSSINKGINNNSIVNNNNNNNNTNNNDTIQIPDHIARNELAHNTFKKLRLQNTFDQIAVLLIFLIVLVVVYYNWLMLAPHLTPIIWAAMFSMVLARPLQFIIKMLTTIDFYLADVKLKIYLTSITVYLLLLISSSLLTIVVGSCIFAFWSFLLFSDRRTVASVVLLLLVITMVGFPSYYIISTCVAESTQLALKIQTFVDQNPEFHNLLEDFGSSPYYKWANEYAAGWGVTLPEYDPEVVKGKIVEVSMMLSTHLSKALTNILSIVSSGAQMIVAFITFLSTLYYFLVNLDTLSIIMADLSPFAEEDSGILFDALHRSVTQTFLSTALIFISHLVGTWVTFSMCSLDLTLFLSLLSAFFACLPIVGAYPIWIPVVLAKAIAGSYGHAFIITTTQLIMQFGFDTFIYLLIPGNTFLIAFGLSMGISLFGFLGIILGPLLAGVLVTILDMYAVYQKLPRLKIKQDNEVELDISTVDQTLSLTATPSFGQRKSTDRPGSANNSANWNNLSLNRIINNQQQQQQQNTANTSNNNITLPTSTTTTATTSATTTSVGSGYMGNPVIICDTNVNNNTLSGQSLVPLTEASFEDEERDIHHGGFTGNNNNNNDVPTQFVDENQQQKLETTASNSVLPLNRSSSSPKPTAIIPLTPSIPREVSTHVPE